MRWKEPSDRVQSILVMPIVIPVLIVAIPVFGPMLMAFWAWDRWGPRPAWRKWFAWRPVRAWDDEARWGYQWVWLEWIEKWSGVSTNADYRFIAKETGNE